MPVIYIYVCKKISKKILRKEGKLTRKIDGWLTELTKPTEQGVMMLLSFGLSTLRIISSKSSICENNKF